MLVFCRPVYLITSTTTGGKHVAIAFSCVHGPYHDPHRRSGESTHTLATVCRLSVLNAARPPLLALLLYAHTTRVRNTLVP